MTMSESDDSAPVIRDRMLTDADRSALTKIMETPTPMLKPTTPSESEAKQCAAKATEPEELERQLMSYSVAKNEREWWAVREIERLRAIECDLGNVLKAALYMEPGGIDLVKRLTTHAIQMRTAPMSSLTPIRPLCG